MMKTIICTLSAVIGGMLCTFLGGLDKPLLALCVIMCADCFSGVVVACVFHNSPKSDTGKVQSRAFLKGVFRKIGMIVLVGIGNILNDVFGVDYIRYGILMAFMASELLSLIENAALMGIPIPKALEEALDIIDNKE